MENDIATLMEEFRAMLDDNVRELLTFGDSDLDKEGLWDTEFGRLYCSLRGAIETTMDEIQVHTGQIQGARYNVAYRKLLGADMDASPPDHLKNMEPVSGEEPWGMWGRSHVSRLAADFYIAGHQLLAQFIGVDESLMEEPSRPGEWSGKEVLEHVASLLAPEFYANRFAPYRKEASEPPA